MSIQVSTRIDEATKKQFDRICEAIGISPSNALSMFIRGVINYKGIPFNVTVPPAISQLAPDQTTLDHAVRSPFAYGSMMGKMWMADDFDDPLEDFKEYME